MAYLLALSCRTKVLFNLPILATDGCSFSRDDTVICTDNKRKGLYKPWKQMPFSKDSTKVKAEFRDSRSYSFCYLSAMNTYIYLHRLRPLISNPVLSSIKSRGSLLNLRSNFSSHTVWRSQLCSARQIQPFQCDALIRPYATSSATSSVPDYKKHNHSALWGTERAISVLSLAILPAVFTVPSENLECLASFVIALHFHWGLEATLTDYIRPAVFGKLIPRFTEVYAAMISGFVFVLLLWCAIYGNGIVRTVQQFWYLDLDINPYIDDDAV